MHLFLSPLTPGRVLILFYSVCGDESGQRVLLSHGSRKVMSVETVWLP
jgi:hypothetical protein